MNLIPIIDETLEMLEELNNGVRPEKQDEETWFVYKGKNEVPEIITLAEMLERAPRLGYKMVNTLTTF